jgi:hypothetical protein
MFHSILPSSISFLASSRCNSIASLIHSSRPSVKTNLSSDPSIPISSPFIIPSSLQILPSQHLFQPFPLHPSNYSLPYSRQIFPSKLTFNYSFPFVLSTIPSIFSSSYSLPSSLPNIPSYPLFYSLLFTLPLFLPFLSSNYSIPFQSCSNYSLSFSLSTIPSHPL